MQQEDFIAEAKEFFEYYKKEIGKSTKEGKKSIYISFHDIASFSHNIAETLLQQPEETLALLGTALDESGLIANAHIRLLDLPSTQRVKIRDIRSEHLNKLISISGLVRQASEIRPKVVNAKFECPSCGSNILVLQTEKHFHEPKRCSCGRKGQFRLLSREMVDSQRLVIEESPESMLGGEQPRRINVFLKEDLVAPLMEKRTTPGAKVDAIGVLKEVPIPSGTGTILTSFDLAIEANNVIPQEESFDELAISEEEEKKIKELSEDPMLYQKLVATIAPSVFGYDTIKEALALQLFGGVRRERTDGTFSRGDIHLLLVGDPGVAKSQMLKFIASIAPKGRYISGKAATGAGITATVVKDEFLRGWSLEAGAMVLANKGILSLDEIEDMRPEDRSAMHEGMEQQTISITKANVQATLRSETSILAAGNPKYGRFDPNQTIPKQINIDVPLLNRFDLIFLIQDIPERVKDDAIATHVLQQRRKEIKGEGIDPSLFKKYIAYAKQKIFPELTDKAVDEIRNFYVELRNNSPSGASTSGENRTIPVTARQLEALIRLSEANARVRLSKKVTIADAKKAIDMLRYALERVAMDQATGQFDIDRIVSGIPSSQRGKIMFVKEVMRRLEERHGKLIPKEEIINEVGDKMIISEIEEIVEELKRDGEYFEPKKGYIERTA